MHRLALACAGLLFFTGCAMTPEIPSAARAELAPGGKLRVGINYGNFLLVLKDGPGGEPRGIAPDLGRELGRRLCVPVGFVRFDAAGKLGDAVQAGERDCRSIRATPQSPTGITLNSPIILVHCVLFSP